MSLTQQQPVVDGLPQSLIAVADGGLAVSSGFVYVFCPPTFDSVPSMPGFAGPANGSEADYTVWGATPGFTASLDLSGVTQVRCVALVHDTGPAGYVVKFKYSSDNEATFHDLVSGGFQFAADATGWADTGWQSLVAGALTSVIIHPFVQGSDNVAVAHIEPLTLQFK